MGVWWFGFFVLVLCVSGVVGERGVACSTPKLRNGRIRSRQRGRIIKFVCQTGFQLAGEKNAFCVNGTWDMPTPKCVRTTCSKKDSPPLNGLILPSHGGGVLNFYCKQGFELHGPAAVFCDGFNWDNHMPSCIPTHTKPKTFCDFEDVDICHWTHDLNHDMDWKRDSYKTPTGYSMETGPSYDHTKGLNQSGHYMYIESSSRRINDTARLISPIFNRTNSITCLEFWYHMYGRTTGTLRAYKKLVSEPWPLKAENAIFSKSGNQGNVWYKAFFDLGSIDDDFQIIMEGVRGNGYVSDIAIDDINIIENCDYKRFMLSTTETPLPVSEILKTVESCANRCGNKSTNYDNPEITPCDCDDYCFETSRCCPDFADVCFLSSSTSDMETTTEIEITSIIPIPGNSTVKNLTVVSQNVTLATKPTIKSTSTSPIFIPTTKRIVTTKKYAIPTKAMPTKRPLIFVTATTVQIYRKILSKTTPNKNNSKIVFIKPKNSSQNFNDVIEVPTKRYNDEELILTSPVSLEEDNNNISLQDKEDYVERISNEKELLESNDVYPENLGKIKTEFRQSQSEYSNVKTIFVVIATVCGVAALAIILLMLLIKYRVVRFRGRRMMSGNGDSQSDVRFLTADEVLDFTLENNDDL